MKNSQISGTETKATNNCLVLEARQEQRHRIDSFNNHNLILSLQEVDTIDHFHKICKPAQMVLMKLMDLISGEHLHSKYNLRIKFLRILT